MWSEDALDQAEDIGAMEDVELGGILLEDLGEGKFLDGASSVVWGAEGDVGGCCGRGICDGRLDGDEAVGGRDESSERA